MIRILSAWLVMLLVSVANGAVRDWTYGTALDELTAHQVSTASGVVLLGIVMWRYLQTFPPAAPRNALVTGLTWTSLTIAFEFLFFHFVGGHAWSELLANYNVLNGRVWVFLLLWIACGPYALWRLQGQLDGSRRKSTPRP